MTRQLSVNSSTGISHALMPGASPLASRGKMQNGSYGVIDNLSITYNGNQLSSVTESAAELMYNGSLDYKGAKGSQYKYNENGSLVSDKSRGIAFISYDMNNNPQQIYFTNGNVTKYVYTASGQKLRVTHYTAVPNISRTLGVKPAELTPAQILSTATTDYMLGGSLVLKNGKIDKVLSKLAFPLLMVLITVFYIQNHRTILDNLGIITVCVTVLILVAIFCSSMLSRLVRNNAQQRRTVVIEVGMQNAAQAIAIATSPFIFGSAEMAIPAILYSLMMNIVLLIYVFAIRKK